MEALFGKTIDLLTGVLDLRSKKHKVLASNIANIDTPNYEPKDLDFERALEGAMASGIAMAKTNPRHMPAPGPGGGYEVVRTGDKVSIDQEMVSLAENHLMYNATVEMLARKFRGLNTVLKEAK